MLCCVCFLCAWFDVMFGSLVVVVVRVVGFAVVCCVWGCALNGVVLFMCMLLVYSCCF